MYRTISLCAIAPILASALCACLRPTPNSNQPINKKSHSETRIPSAKSNAEEGRSMKRIRRIKRLEDTTIRFGGCGDNWHMTWAKNDKQYAAMCDGFGWPGMPQAFYNSRLYGVIGNPPDVKFEFLPDYPKMIQPGNNPEICQYYSFGILALDDCIYQYLSTPSISVPQIDARFVGAKLIYSSDKGHTWRNQDGSTPIHLESWKERSKNNMVFFNEPGESFGLITVLQMGRNYEQNKDGYVYLYSPNGTLEGKMNQLVMCRVQKDKILDRKSYQFFAGTNQNGEAAWSSKIEDRAVVSTFPSGWVNKLPNPYAWHPSVVYYAPLNLYLMANWGMGRTDDNQWFSKPSYLGFWTAPQPWGPWKQVYEEKAWTPANDINARAYQPQIAPKWIAEDGKSFWLVWTDYQTVEGSGKMFNKPFYSFNAQKVEVIAE